MPSLTTRVTLSSDPRCSLATAKAFRAATRAAFPACRSVEFLADTPNKFWLLVFGRKHAAEEQQIAGLDSLDISAERRRRLRELDT